MMVIMSDLNQLDRSRTEVVESAYTYNEEFNGSRCSELIDATDCLLNALRNSGFSDQRIEEIKSWLNEKVKDE